MLRRLLPLLVVALAAVPAALADGGTSPPVSQGWDGALAPGGKVRYVAVGTGRDTAVEAIRTSAGRRWAYTLYSRPGGYPFVHALDTLRGVAHCIGLPFQGNQDALWRLRMSVRDGGRTLALDWRSGRPYLAVATGTWRISHPAPAAAAATRAGFPWWILGAVGGALLLGVALLLVLRRT